MSWLKSVEDKLFKASRVTHVANASDEDIYVKVEADKKYAEEDFNVSAGGVAIKSGKNNWDKCEADGFTKIAPNNFVKFEPDTSNSPNVYITVVNKDGEVICDGISKTVNASVIVDRSVVYDLNDSYSIFFFLCNLLDTKMGTIWTDTSGKCHK